STDTPSGFAAIPTPPPGGPHVVFASDNTPTFAPATLASATFMTGEPQITMERPVPGSPAPPGIDPNRIFIDWPLSSRSNTGQLSRSLDGGDSFRLLFDPLCAARQRPNCVTGGGGDTEEAVNPLTGELYFADQGVLAQAALANSP